MNPSSTRNSDTLPACTQASTLVKQNRRPLKTRAARKDGGDAASPRRTVSRELVFCGIDCSVTQAVGTPGWCRCGLDAWVDPQHRPDAEMMTAAAADGLHG